MYRGCRERKKIEPLCDFIELKNNKLHHKYNICKKRWLTPLGRLIKKFQNTHKLWNNDLKKFILLVKKGVYPYDYMDSWERFDETILPNKKAFCSELYLEDITDEDYIHAQKVFEELNIKNLGKYNDLYVQSSTLMFADVFENFRNICYNIYELEFAYFLSASELAWQACLKKTGVKLE